MYYMPFWILYSQFITLICEHFEQISVSVVCYLLYFTSSSLLHKFRSNNDESIESKEYFISNWHDEDWISITSLNVYPKAISSIQLKSDISVCIVSQYLYQVIGHLVLEFSYLLGILFFEAARDVLYDKNKTFFRV